MAYYRKKSSDRLNIKKLVFYYIALLIFIFAASAVEISGLKIFNCAPALTFVSVCAIGFIFGERSGAIFGLIGGVLIDAIGFSGSALSPIVFTVCGYLCGSAVGWFLSKNLPSFMIYGLIACAIKEIFKFLIIEVMSTDIDLLHTFGKIIIPEYFATLIFLCPIYLVVFGIYRVFSLKDKKEFRF